MFCFAGHLYYSSPSSHQLEGRGKDWIEKLRCMLMLMFTPISSWHSTQLGSLASRLSSLSHIVSFRSLSLSCSRCWWVMLMMIMVIAMNRSSKEGYFGYLFYSLDYDGGSQCGTFWGIEIVAQNEFIYSKMGIFNSIAISSQMNCSIHSASYLWLSGRCYLPFFHVCTRVRYAKRENKA